MKTFYIQNVSNNLLRRVSLFLLMLLFASVSLANDCKGEAPYPAIGEIDSKINFRKGNYPCKVSFTGTITHVEQTENGYVSSVAVNLENAHSFSATLYSSLGLSPRKIWVGRKVEGQGLILDEAYDILQIWVFKLE